MKFAFVILLSSFGLATDCSCQSRVKTGDEVFIEKYLSLIEGRKVGIITNQSSFLSRLERPKVGIPSGQNGKHIVHVLSRIPGVKVAAIFAPEHGIRGDSPAGGSIADSIDEETGIRVFSLYGKITKPTPEMLKGIDVLIYDIQDVGARFYTFISTLDLTLEAAAENHIKYIVLDRPDMLRADLVDGPVLVDSLRSFVGIQPIPSAYGMTPGEFATMINDEHLLKNGVKTNLTVIKMVHYKRSMWYDQTGLEWITPSPNLPDMNSVEVYPGNVLFEGTNISEGRGTEQPFENIGAPFIDSQKLIDLLDQQHLAGVEFEPSEFTPRSFHWATDPKYNGVLCHGVKLTVVDRDIFKPVEMGVTIIWAIHKLYPDQFRFHDPEFDRLCGTPNLRPDLMSGKSLDRIFSEWNRGIREFKKIRAKYLLYK